MDAATFIVWAAYGEIDAALEALTDDPQLARLAFHFERETERFP